MIAAPQTAVILVTRSGYSAVVRAVIRRAHAEMEQNITVGKQVVVL